MLPPLPDSVVRPEIAAARQDSAEAKAPILNDGCAYCARRPA